MKVTQTAGGVVVNRNQEILVVNQNHNSWSLPKGHIDPGEDQFQAAVREIYEESGISNVTFIKNLGSYQRYRIALDGGDDLSESKEIFMMFYKTDEMQLNPQDKDNPEACWVKIDDVAALLTHRKDKQFFEKIIPDLKIFLEIY